MKFSKFKLLVIALLLVLLLVISVIFAVLNMGNNSILSKIYINNVDVSNKSTDEAIKELKDLTNKKNKEEINFEYINDKKKYEKIIDISILDVDYHIEDSVNTAYSLGRTGNIIQNNYIIAKTLFIPKKIDLNLSYDEEMINTIINVFAII